ncbi:MAG: xanthine dehydrogenase family protein molybdopterin-binding subunit [Treponema sp.]|nr:xanthine dehydrogenase family protein molybdopterin-binding subunit [Treponema sp.]
MEKPEFIDDIAVLSSKSKALSGVLIRSPVAKGVLKDIEIPALPNKVRVIKAADIPGKNRLEGPGGSLPVLAEKELSYIGEPVAILTGPDKSALLELASRCRVLAKAETPVFDPLAPRTAAARTFSTGNLEQAFAAAAKIIGDVYVTGFQDAWGTDPNGAVAIPVTGVRQNPVTGMVVHTASQWPSHVRDQVSGILGISPAAVEVKQARMELHMDGKILYPSLCACHAALAAWITRKPVKLVLSREEDFLFSPKRVKTEISLRSALDETGRILGTEMKVCADMGAAGFFAGEILDRVILGALGAYHHKTLAIEAKASLTSIPPSGPLTGFGFSQGFFAMERHASHIADELREDPAEWRKNVFLQKGTKLAIGNEIRDQISLEGLLDTASSMSDYRRKWAAFELLRQRRRADGHGRGKITEPLRGIGIASAFQGRGLLYPVGTREGVELTLEKDGSLEIRTRIVSFGEEQIYPWKTIAARELGVAENLVRIVTEGKQIPDSGPACLSRNIALITRLVERSCEAIKKQRFRDPLPITVRRFYHPSRGRAWGSEIQYDENALSDLSWGTAVVEAEIDPIEYIPRVRGVWLAVDGGPILAENRAKKNLTLLSIQALNWVSRENVVYKNGKIPPEAIGNYALPLPEEIPPVKIDFQWSDGNPRGIGELPFSVVPAAYAQAVSQAMDHHFTKLPIGSAEIWELVKAREPQETHPHHSAHKKPHAEGEKP